MSQTAAPSATDPISLWGLVIEGFHAADERIHRDIARQLDLDRAEAETLLRMARADHSPKTMAEIAREAQFSSGGFTKIADRLVRRELACRTRCSQDRRVVYFALTSAGQHLADRLQDLAARAVQSVFIDALGEERAQLLAAAMRDLRDSTDAPDRPEPSSSVL